jgi:hypothetical protein
MGTRINTVMQVCFFALSGVLPRDQAIEQIKYTIKKTYGRKGEDVVRKNIEAVDQTLANLFEVPVPEQITSGFEMPDPFTADAPNRIKETLGKIYPGWATNCRSARSRATGPSRPRPRNMRNGTWRSRSRSGTRRPASSAASARRFVRTRRSG